MDTNILNSIRSELDEIERLENVKILHSVESGSRAWGFASPDSDYDVRFVYVRPVKDYLRLDNTRDVIEWKLDDTLDINGWDLKKALQLLHSSNPTLFEWNYSPIVYKTTEDWGKVRKIIDSYFRAKQGLYHYLNTAKGNFRKYLKGDEVKLKEYFYVLRPILACRYILKNNTPPPMLFSELVETELDSRLRPAVDDLVKRKKEESELGKGKRIDILNDYIESSLEEIENILSGMPDAPLTDWAELNGLFTGIVMTEM